MKIFCAVGAIGVAGIGSFAHGATLFEYSVLNSSESVLVQDENQIETWMKARVLDELANRFGGVHTEFQIAFNNYFDFAISETQAFIKMSDGPLVGAEYGCEMCFMTRGGFGSSQMDVVLASFVDVTSLRGYLDPRYGGSGNLERGHDVEFYTFANMIVWMAAMVSTSARFTI